MSQIFIVGGAAIVALIAYTFYEEKKKNEPPTTPAPPGPVGVNNPNGGLVPPGCTVWAGAPAGSPPGLWACPNIAYNGQTGVVVSAIRYPAYDPMTPQITIPGSDDKYYFREWLPAAIGI